MPLTDTLLTIGILLGIMILVYLKMTKKTITDFVGELREIIRNEKMEVIDI